MTTTATDETILTATDFQERFKAIQAKAKLRPRPEPTHADWLERTFGIFADDPTWDEHLRFLVEERNREATSDDNVNEVAQG